MAKEVFKLFFESQNHSFKNTYKLSKEQSESQWHIKVTAVQRTLESLKGSTFLTQRFEAETVFWGGNNLNFCFASSNISTLQSHFSIYFKYFNINQIMAPYVSTETWNPQILEHPANAPAKHSHLCLCMYVCVCVGFASGVNNMWNKHMTTFKDQIASSL